jgi:hypothetical protein
MSVNWILVFQFPKPTTILKHARNTSIQHICHHLQINIHTTNAPQWL